MNFLKSTFSSLQAKDIRKSLFLDIGAFLIVFLTPRIGQLLHLPFYMIEPMRLMVILSIAHFYHWNSYFLALALPFFSWAVTGHPELLKMMVMTVEIVINVFLFYYFVKRIESVFLSMIIAIVISKITCYAFYLIFFSMMFIQEEAEPSFLVAQVVTTLVFSTYIALTFRKNKSAINENNH